VLISTDPARSHAHLDAFRIQIVFSFVCYRCLLEQSVGGLGSFLDFPTAVLALGFALMPPGWIFVVRLDDSLALITFRGERDFVIFVGIAGEEANVAIVEGGILLLDRFEFLSRVLLLVVECFVHLVQVGVATCLQSASMRLSGNLLFTLRM